MTNNTTIETSLNGSMPSFGDCMVLQMQDFVPWNNPDNIVSVETRELVRKLKDLLFLPITFLIGVPANVLNMLVFHRHGLKERINVCLFALSLADGLYLVLMLAYGEQIYLHLTTSRLYSPALQWITNHYLLGFYGVTWVSHILTAIIASERCFCILQPLISMTVLRTSTMKAIIAIIFVVVIAGRFIVVTRYYTICAYDPFRKSIIMAAIGGDFYNKHQILVEFLDVFVYGVGLPWMVIVVVVVTTIVTVFKLRQAAEWREGTSSSTSQLSARDIALTRMLVGNSIFFIVCIFPVGFFRLLTLLFSEIRLGKRHHNLFTMSLYLLNIISFINSTFNFVVYYTMGSRYRLTVRTLLGKVQEYQVYPK